MKLTQNRFIRGGLRFQCTGCGSCCRARGNVVHVFLAPADAEAMAGYLHLSKDQFLQEHCDVDPEEGIPVLKGQSGDCRFLDSNGACTVYPVRPAQCVAWPFWIENLNPESWERDVVPVCPGAGQGRLWSAEEIDRIAMTREDAFNCELCETLKPMQLPPDDGTLSYILRPEAAADYRTVEELTREAFWDLQVPGCDEHYLVHLMRDHVDFLPQLSFVAELDKRIIGNIMTTRARLVAGDRTLSAVSVGPVTVHPDFQRRGVGRAMINQVLALSKAEGAAALVLLGHPHNYVSYGFKNGKDLGISYTDGSHPLGLLAMELTPGALAGEDWIAHFSSVFEIPDGLDPFDATFPPREKTIRPSQELFSMVLRARLP